MLVLKNCEPELSYILAERFNTCQKESCFPDFWMVSLVLPTAKSYRPVSLISVVSKGLKNL